MPLIRGSLGLSRIGIQILRKSQCRLPITPGNGSVVSRHCLPSIEPAVHIPTLLTLHRRACMQTPMGRALSAEEPIETPRLLLISVTEAMLHADRSGKGLGDILNAVVPNTWPPQYWDQRAIDYLLDRVRRHPHYRGWCRYVTLKQAAGAPPVLIGGCGCTEPPETLEDVEIGYSILNEFRRHGYVTEAIDALVPWIFTYNP